MEQESEQPCGEPACIRSLREWCAEYKRLAVERNVEWIYSGDEEDYQHAFDDEYTPLEYLIEEIDVAASM